MRRRLLPIAISVVGALLVGLLVYGISHQSASRTLDNAVAEGREPRAPAADTTLPVLGSTARSSLVSLRGKVVLLNFWASWCEPCRVEAPLLQRSQATLLAHRATVLGVAYLDASPDSQRFVRHYGLSYPNLREEDNGNFARAYGTDKLPESFIIDRLGRVAAIARGEIDQAFIDKALKLARST